MQIEKAGTQNPVTYGYDKVSFKGNRPVEEPEREEPKTETLSDEPEQAVEQSGDNEKVRGVIRLLQDGHFKGVADVRLRINFHEELAAMENVQLRVMAEGSVQSLVKSVRPELDLLVESGRVDAETADAALTKLD